MSLGQRLRALDARLQAGPTPPPRTDEAHTCAACGEAFRGRFCPQCGADVRRRRFTVRGAMLHFLDLWGFGSRSIFRTVAQLYYRPGYLIADYLQGRQQLYFPPFQLLVTSAVIYLAVVHLAGLEPDMDKAIAENSEMIAAYDDNPRVQQFLDKMLRQAAAIPLWLHEHIEIGLLLYSVFSIFVTWSVFSWPVRKRRPATRPYYNLIETFYAQLYVASQMLLLSVPCILLAGRQLSLDDDRIFPWHLPNALVILLLSYTYMQLYRLSPWGALWRTAVASALIVGAFVVLLIVAVVVLFGFLVATELGPT